MYISELEIQEGITIEAKGAVVTVKGKNGESNRNFGHGVEISVDGKKIKVSTNKKAMLNTVIGHISNMFKGVNEGYTKKMKMLYAHFPATIEVKGKEVLIKNFLGEKHPRKAKINGEAKVAVKGQDITITGVNKEDVGQTAANLKTATKITKRDCRIFQDGIYPVGE